MRRPIDAPINITTEHGENVGNLARFGRHSGVDYGVNVGRHVYAPAKSRVAFSAYDPTGGNMLILFDGKYYHRLMHNQRLHVPLGAEVSEGQHIADADSTGLSSGHHVHWDICTKYRAESFADFVDPWQWLNTAPPPAPAPKPAPIVDVLQPHQRLVGSFGVNKRRAPSISAEIVQEYAPNDPEPFNFVGYVKGEAYAGNEIWYVGTSGLYFWSGSFKDSSINGLKDLTPVNPPVIPPVSPPPAPVTPDPIPPVIPSNPGTVVTPDHTQHVIDISSHNEIVDYPTVRASVRGVIAKAGHTGKSYNGVQPYNGDPTFATYKAGLGDKLIGAYWYGYPSLDPKVEATAFLNMVGSVPNTFSYWLDIEEMDGQPANIVNDWCQEFLETVERVTGRKCGIYLNRNWFNTIIDATTKSTRPIWLAHYDIPEMANPVTNQVAHQFTSDGTVAGFAANDRVDINAVTDAFFIAPPVVAPVVDLEPRVQRIEQFLSNTFKNF